MLSSNETRSDRVSSICDYLSERKLSYKEKLIVRLKKVNKTSSKNVVLSLIDVDVDVI